MGPFCYSLFFSNLLSIRKAKPLFYFTFSLQKNSCTLSFLGFGFFDFFFGQNHWYLKFRQNHWYLKFSSSSFSVKMEESLHFLQNFGLYYSGGDLKAFQHSVQSCSSRGESATEEFVEAAGEWVRNLNPHAEPAPTPLCLPWCLTFT